MKKFKSLPIFMQITTLAFGMGLTGASILAIFKIDLGTIPRSIFFLLCVAGSYIIIKKPFKKDNK